MCKVLKKETEMWAGNVDKAKLGKGTIMFDVSSHCNLRAEFLWKQNWQIEIEM